MSNVDTISNKNIQCAWCGVNLSNANKITYLNGNLPICDLCLINKAGVNYKLILGGEENPKMNFCVGGLGIKKDPYNEALIKIKYGSVPK